MQAQDPEAMTLAAGRLHGVSAEEMFRLAVEACPSGMIMTERSGAIVMLNTEIELLFGYSREELIGQSIETLVPPGSRGQHVRRRAAFALHPETRRMGAGRDLFGLRKDATEFPVELGLNPVNTTKGELVLCVIADITERKRIERLKDEFVSTVSHELRTPLTSIHGSLALLAGGAAGNLPDAALRLLTIAQKNSERLIRLINDILDIEKIESGEVVFDMKRIEVRQLVEQAIEANRGYAESLGVTIRFDPASAAGEVQADPDRLAQVIANLLSNGIKFSPSGEEVFVSIAGRSDQIRITVRDHGPGIPPNFKARIYEKFAQADNTSGRKTGGTGLGLSIVKRIVTRLGGTTGFDDAPGGGSIFHFDLPVFDSPADVAGAPIGHTNGA
jgi:PAS domain S-box-containing protein